MAKVTGKFQITLPKALVDECEIRVGEELDFHAIGGSIQIDRRFRADGARLRAERMNQFDRATKRQRNRQAVASTIRSRSRGWTREELYRRGRAR